MPKTLIVLGLHLILCIISSFFLSKAEFGLFFLSLLIFFQLASYFIWKKNYFRFLLFFSLFIGKFFFSFFKANLSVAKIILKGKKKKIYSNFEQIDISHLTSLEVLLLTHFITLTPGSVSADLTEDSKTLIVHILRETKGISEQNLIQKELITPMKRWSR